MKPVLHNTTSRYFRTSENYLIHLLFFTLFLSSFFRIHAQQPPVQIDSLTLKLIRETTDEKGKETGAVIILKDYQMTIKNNGLNKLVIRVLGKVYSKEAMLDYSQIPLMYNSYYEEPALNYARVIHKDGTVREVPRDAVQANNDQKCIEYSQKAVALNPAAYYARFNIALANLRSGNIQEARKLYGELKKQSLSITESDWNGAAKDLHDLMTKGIYVMETKAILKDYFDKK